jgi:hypothetical protein
MINFAQIPILGAVSKYTPEYNAILNRAVALGYTLPSEAMQVVQNDLIIALKNAGVWDSLDTFYNYFHNGGESFGFIDWRNPTRIVTETGSVSFTSVDGSISDGSTGYYNTNYSPNTDGVNWQVNSASYFVDIKENIQEAAYFLGYQETVAVTVTRLRPRSASDVLEYRLDNLPSGGGVTTVAHTDGSGFFHVQRRAINDLRCYHNGTLKDQNTGTSGTGTNTDGTLHLFHVNVTGSAISAKTARCFGAGGQLAGKESDLNTIWSNYKTNALAV